MTTRYRVRAFDGDYEVLAKDRYMAALDLDTEAGLVHARRHLNDLLHTITQAAQREDRNVGMVQLRIFDWDTGEHVMDWIG